MKRFLLVSLLGLLSVSGRAQVQSPSEFLGYPFGTTFTYHHQIVAYLEHVAANSDRVKVEYYGQTNERRPLLVAYITSPANHANLETIRTDNLKRSMAQEADTRKAIVWLSYNVHGNEASASEASLLTLYTLATTQDPAQQAWLDNTVVVIDPCLNPDGRDRYTHWNTQINGFAANANPEAWEHSEPWPGGRPNHYLFDLNRDWAWQTQVESQGRMALYQRWMPHVHVDFHEQFINSPYYFAPAAEPFHDVITDFQRDFQTKIGQNHARYFDQEGWLYFTREVFDLLYPSYGDTYPTFNGAIGMTYEQAGHGMSGLAIDIEGKDTLTLIDRLTHHHTTGLSTIEVSSQNADDLIDNFGKYFQDQAKGVGSQYKTYVIPAKGQRDKGNALIDFLQLQAIDYWIADGNKNAEGFSYQTNSTQKFTVREGDLIVPANQARGGLVRALFEPTTKLSTPITYDITAWALPYVYGLEAYAVENTMSAPSKRQGRMSTGVEVPPFNPNAPYGYILPWKDLRDAQVLAGWLKAGLQVRFSEVPFAQGGYDYPAGSIIVLRADNPDFPGESFGKAVQKPLTDHSRVVRETNTGWVVRGKDFGSGSVKVLTAPRIAVLGGEGTSSLNHGETWYYFEQVLGYPVTRINTSDAGGVDWSEYDVVVLPEGGYWDLFGDGGAAALLSWVREGGTAIALGRAVGALAGQDGFSLARKGVDSDDEEDEDEAYRDRLRRYADQEAEFVKGFNPGSIYEVSLDNSHPLAFGYGDTYFSLKTGSQAFEYMENGWNVGYIAGDGKPRAGYVGEQLYDQLSESLVLGVESKGSGAVVYFVDNPLFRAFWRNGHLMMANAVFLVNRD